MVGENAMCLQMYQSSVLGIILTCFLFKVSKPYTSLDGGDKNTFIHTCPQKLSMSGFFCYCSFCLKRVLLLSHMSHVMLHFLINKMKVCLVWGTIWWSLSSEHVDIFSQSPRMVLGEIVRKKKRNGSQETFSEKDCEKKKKRYQFVPRWTLTVEQK